MSMENGIISGFSVSDKASSIHQQQQNSSGFGLGLMLQSTESIIPADNSNMSMNPMMMMMFHNHHRPFSSSYERNGPTCSSDIYDVAGAAAANSCGGAVVRTLQPFDIFSAAAAAASAPTAALKSPGGMAASLGFFPFTNAQKKELERQAMIYKYMMASVPVPPDLLFPITRNPSDPASHSNLGKGSVFNLRYTNNTDSEPGRCRRTDGKKWRCSRDVAPDRKYCERHMNRGRPRSRKPVELHSHFNNKTHLHNDPPSTPKINSTASFSTRQYLGSTSQPYDQSQTPVFVCKSEEKVSPFESVVSASSYKEPRSLEWMMKQEAVPMATSDQEWHHLMQTKIGLTTETSFCDTYASVFQQPCKEEPLNLNSYTHFNGGEDQQNNEMVFIDAWSNAVTEDNNVHSSNKNSVSSSSNGELSLSSLALSMASHNTMNEEMGQIQMGLGIIQSDHNPHGSSISNVNKPQISTWLTQSSWVGPTPGGPLAEVLRPSTVTAGAGTASNPASPIPGNGDSGTSQATTVSSPSGVLQKTLVAMSDSSCGSSPTLVASTVKPEIAVQWLNQSNLGSYSSSWV